MEEILKQYPWIGVTVAALLLLAPKVRLFLATIIPVEIRKQNFKIRLMERLIEAKYFDLVASKDQGIKDISYISEKLSEKAFDEEE